MFALLTGSESRKSLSWWAGPLLTLPALIPLARSYVDAFSQGKVATGFIIYDMAYYMANAREHFDQGFQLTYGNPYASYSTPAIYFQPQTLLLGCLQHMGLDPALAFNLFGLVALFFAGFVAMRFYEYVVGLETTPKRVGLVCFFWGGGILSLAGSAVGLFQHQPILDSLLTYDISGGWWMFNFGRNLTYPTEAYYHGVFLLCLLCLMRRQFRASLALGAVMSLSHPFTGLSLALILFTWSALELSLKSGAVTRWFVAGSATLLAGHLAYYQVFLNRFPDHRGLREQWELDWLYSPSTYIPALFLVACLAGVRLFRRPALRESLRDPRVRLFLVWFLAIFGLSQHNLLIKPMQPVHFAHGYDWTALFFLGAPVLISMLDSILKIQPFRLRYACLLAVAGVLLLDNAIRYTSFFAPARQSQALILTSDQMAVLKWLNRNAAPPDMVVSQDDRIGYLVSTYTRVRSWRGHKANTPLSDQRRTETQRAFTEGRILPEWARMQVLYVVGRKTNWKPPPGTAAVYQNNGFIIWGRPDQESAGTLSVLR
jgi:hypothetical protein